MKVEIKQILIKIEVSLVINFADYLIEYRHGEFLTFTEIFIGEVQGKN